MADGLMTDGLMADGLMADHHAHVCYTPSHLLCVVGLEA